jgi:hypothetical protein
MPAVIPGTDAMDAVAVSEYRVGHEQAGAT